MDLGLHRLGWEIHREGITFILIPGDQVLCQSGKVTTWSSGAEASGNYTVLGIGLTAFFPPSCYSVPSVCARFSLAPKEGKRHGTR